MAKSRSKQTGYDRLAQDYLDLMQRQMSGAITHPDFIRSMLELTQAMGHARTERYTSPTSRAEHDAVSKLERRVAKLERQLADLLAVPKPRGSDGKRSTRGKVRPKQASKRKGKTKKAKRASKRR